MFAGFPGARCDAYTLAISEGPHLLIQEDDLLAIVRTNVNDEKINLIREQDLAETAQAIAQALPWRRNRIVTTDTSWIVTP